MADKTNPVIINSACNETLTNTCGIIIFGASGDLTFRKLLPALFNLYIKKILKENFYIIGCARSSTSTLDYRKEVKEIFTNEDKNAVNNFIDRIEYLSGDYSDSALYKSLLEKIHLFDKKYSTNENILFYMATPPHLYSIITENLGINKLTIENTLSNSYRRIIFEKPFGHDLSSALQLDRELHQYLSENQIYRIDHYLGKDTVQNILMFRFANSIFEPIWNQHFIDNIQITVAESIGVEHRAGYYDKAGQLRDMFQNHLMQLLCMIGIEPPASFDADSVRDETSKLIRAIQPFELNKNKPCIIRSQYIRGKINSEDVLSYREEEGVAKESQTETYAAAKIFVNNWRWKGVPFYLRSGKRIAKKFSQIVITFKNVPHSMFSNSTNYELPPNKLVINIQPNEGISFIIQAKIPGPKLCIGSLDLDFYYKDSFGDQKQEPYERLILDCIAGDQTLFWRHDGIEHSWKLLTPVLQAWENSPDLCPLTYYKSGSFGPVEGDSLLEQDGKKWFNEY